MSETHVKNENESRIPAVEVSEAELEGVSGGTPLPVLIAPLLVIGIAPGALVPPTADELA